MRTLLALWLVVTFAVTFGAAVSCGGAVAAKSTHDTESPHADPTADGLSSSMSNVEAGAPRICVHDSKDLAPCSEDCDRGIAFACGVVATRIEHGDGAPKDLTRALRLHERACELRDAASCVAAARMYERGAGVPPSRAKQVELLGTACTLGDALACSVAAKAFANGTGVVRDERRAADLLQRACAGGVATACEELERPAP